MSVAAFVAFLPVPCFPCNKVYVSPGAVSLPARRIEGSAIVSTIEIYKKNQGRYTRVGTFIGVMLIGLVGAYILSRQLTGYDWAESSYVRFGIPVLLVAALAGLMFWMMNRAKSADFLIATESEMKKVAWSSKKEVIGSTKVVLVATFIMAVLLAVVDLLFILLFSQMGVRIGW